MDMRTHWKRIVAVALGAILLFGAVPAFGRSAFASLPTTAIDSTYAAERASRLLSEIRAETATLRGSAETLLSLSRHPQYSWKSHAEYLDDVKSHINSVGDRTAELQRIQTATLPWQKQAISEVTSHAARVAASTQAALLYLNENRGRLFVPEYKDHVATIASSSEDMQETVSKYLDFEKTQQRFNQLQYELELSPD
jgi:hypothetical protein